MDLAPTFLEAAGEAVPEVMTGKSVMPLVQSEKQGQVDPDRTWVITGRERHVANAREGFVPYPHRALRTQDYLYIVNFRPDRWPMGDPKTVSETDMPSIEKLTNNTFIAFGDLDASPTKAHVIAKRASQKKYYDFAFAKRPAEELYVIADDPDQIHNVAADPAFASTKRQLREQLMNQLNRFEDPRVTTKNGEHFEKPPYAGHDPGW